MIAPMTTRARYSTVAIVLHWAIAALLIFQVGLGFRMEEASGAAAFALFQLHKSIGIAILLLVAIRLLWRLVRTPPPISAKPWEKALAHGTHTALYALMLLLPLTGWIIISTSRIAVPTLVFGWIPWPHLPVPQAWHGVSEFLHENLVWVLIALFALHVAGALKHHFIDHDGELARMAPGAGAGGWSDPRLLAIAAGVVLAAGLGLRWSPGGTRAATAPAAVVAAPAAEREEPAPGPPPLPVPLPVPNATPAPAATGAQKQPVSAWRIAGSSTLTFHTSWSGDAIDGGFKTFNGDIVFSPDDLAASKVSITVDTGSVYSGDPQRDETLKSSDWFSAASFGTATYSASKWRKMGVNRYVADGMLKIKGVSLPSAVRFTLTITGDTARMRGTATVDRTAFKIGEGEYSSTADIPAAVAVRIAVDATRAK